MFDKPTQSFLAVINNLHEVKNKDVSIAFAVVLSAKLVLPKVEVEDSDAFIKSHSVEAVVRYLDIADLLELDMPLIIGFLRNTARYSYDMRYARSKLINIDKIKDGKVSTLSLCSMEDFISKDILDTVKSEDFLPTYTFVIKGLRAAEKTMKEETLLRGEEYA